MSEFGCTKDKLSMSIKQMRFSMPFTTISVWHTLDFFDVGRKIMPITTTTITKLEKITFILLLGLNIKHIFGTICSRMY